MTQDYYRVLGVERGASEEAIKAAYRKLAMEHHPDREGGDEAKFKEIKEAYEVLSDPRKRANYEQPESRGWGGTGSSIDELVRRMHEQMRAQHQRAQENSIPFIHIKLNLERAFNGATVNLQLHGSTIPYAVRPGIPPGATYTDSVKIGDKERQIQVQITIDTGAFDFRAVGSSDGHFFCGDLETTVSVDALDILAGGWIDVTDFCGKKLAVRVPSGFDLQHRLKVAGHGYSNWRGENAAERADLYLRVLPVFKPLKALDLAKVTELQRLVKEAQ